MPGKCWANQKYIPKQGDYFNAYVEGYRKHIAVGAPFRCTDVLEGFIHAVDSNEASRIFEIREFIFEQIGAAVT